MRKFLILVLFIICSLAVLHSRHTINYQAVVCNHDGYVLRESPVGMQFRILEDNKEVYREEVVVRTTEQGLINYQIGSSGFELLSIDWSADDLKLEVSLDLNGGNDYSSVIVSEIAATPLALTAIRSLDGEENAANIINLQLLADSLCQSMGNLSNRFDNFEFDTDSLFRSINSLSFSLASLEEEIDTLNLKSDYISLSLDSLGLAVDTLGISVDSIAGNLRTELDSLKVRIDSLERRIAELPQELEKKTHNQVSDKINTSIRELLLPNPFSDAPHYYHFEPNGFIRDVNGNPIIASQSLEDIEMAARLGFKFIEANVHKTADGKFVCLHGAAGKFGSAVPAKFRNELISESTLDYIKSNIVYDSNFEKYRSPILSLEEFCEACKIHNIGIFAGTGDREAIETCIRILGENRVIIYNPPWDIRTYFNGYVFQWWNGDDPIEALLGQADRYGPPYMCGLGPNILSNYLDSNRVDLLISEMHRRHCLVGVTGVYDTEDKIREAMKKGMDFNCSGHEVNPFESNYEHYDIELGIQDFQSAGHHEGGILYLGSGDALSCGTSSPLALGMGQLNLRFKGKLKVEFGSKSGSKEREIESDGTETIILSDYFFHRPTLLKITALEETEIKVLVYRTSKV